MNPIAHPIRLEGRHVLLEPLETSYFEALFRLSCNPDIWTHYAIDGSDREKLRKSMNESLQYRDTGVQYPFVVRLKRSRQIVGSTRLLDINPTHRKLEIGWTWLHPEYWGSPVNADCKFQLLNYCFEQLGAQRVQLKTDKLNLRSRNAILKIGATFEGILRNDMVRDNGTNRDSAYFSIILNDWPQIKPSLTRMLDSMDMIE